MTIITSIVSPLGIIAASDSNVTRTDNDKASSDPKVFPLGFTNGALALCGSYRTGNNERMDTWMPACIESYARTDSPTQAGFAEHLKLRLESDLSDAQKTGANLYQIVGYVEDDDGIHPALHFVRNAWSMNTATGAYEDIRPEFQVSEDFWQRDYPKDRQEGLVNPHWSRRYFNGTPDGRIAFAYFGESVRQFLQAVWLQPSWKFRPPETLGELASLVELQIRAIGTLYEVSDYRAPFIGGDPQIYPISTPTGAVILE